MSVQGESGAAKAGVIVGDIINAIDGAAIESPQHLRSTLREMKPEREITLRVLRGGEPREIRVRV
jgi:S1-C subfamily serine protease